MVEDTLLRDYQSKLTSLQQQQAELLTQFTPEYNKVERIAAQIKSIEAALQQRRAEMLQQIRNQYEEAINRETLLQGNYAKETEDLSQEGAKAVTYGLLKRELDSNRALYDAMSQRTKVAGLVSNIRASNAQIIDSAVPHRAPVSPNTLMNTLTAFLGSVLLGFAVVALRERSNRTIRRPGEMRNYLNIVELGVIPRSDRRRLSLPYAGRRGNVEMAGPLPDPEHERPSSGMLRRSSSAVIASAQKDFELAESFQSVLASLLFSGTISTHSSVIVITSPNPKEGKTTIASNLAIALAGVKGSVLLIDGDMRRPRLHEIFNLSRSAGLADLLERTPDVPEPTLRDSVQDTNVPGLFVLPAGERRASTSIPH